MREKVSVPAIRFAGFTDDWKQLQFSETFDFLQNNTLSRAELSYDSGIAKNVHYGDILIKFGEYLDVSKATLPYISAQHVVDKFKGSLLQDGDVIMADTAEDESVGKCTEVVEIQGFPTISGLHTIPIRPKEKYAAGYLGYYMNSGAYHDQLLPLMQGIKVTSVSKSAIQNTNVSFPADISEQSAIGRYFIQLDNLITLHQRKYTKLVNFKKAMLEKMFPKNGVSVPEIRLDGFTDEWEQRNLGSVTDILSAARVHKENWVSSGVPFFRSSDVVAAFKKTANEKAYITMELYKRLSVLSGKLEKGDILITGGGSIGIPYIVPNDDPLYSKDADLIWIKRSSKYDSEYLYAYITAPIFRAYIGEISHIGTIAHYTIEQVKDTPIAFPSINEQKGIGNFFRSLDSLVTLHQRKLERLQNIKKACLEKMFV